MENLCQLRLKEVKKEEGVQPSLGVGLFCQDRNGWG